MTHHFSPLPFFLSTSLIVPALNIYIYSCIQMSIKMRIFPPLNQFSPIFSIFSLLLLCRHRSLTQNLSFSFAIKFSCAFILEAWCDKFAKTHGDTFMNKYVTKKKIHHHSHFFTILSFHPSWLRNLHFGYARAHIKVSSLLYLTLTHSHCMRMTRELSFLYNSQMWRRKG